ncbi:hypothetical protein CEXT_393621 [Caerostris extrusa]|uniref:Reverse transcriptase n=1 Tax=Caerostris extrusa TaxID=172846 RepID=A0AAV4NYE3_CAEEX|nr:hypothetical protein CEXT_393621 [Caerostris extrusa]
MGGKLFSNGSQIMLGFLAVKRWMHLQSRPCFCHNTILTSFTVRWPDAQLASALAFSTTEDWRRLLTDLQQHLNKMAVSSSVPCPLCGDDSMNGLLICSKLKDIGNVFSFVFSHLYWAARQSMHGRLAQVGCRILKKNTI